MESISHSGIPVDRHNFFISPPERYVIDREHTVNAARPTNNGSTSSSKQQQHLRAGHPPHYLHVVVAASMHVIEPAAFASPIPVAPGYQAKGPVAEQQSEGTSSNALLPGGSSSFISVPIYAWQDTTLREVLEVVMQRCGAARRMLTTPADSIHKHQHQQQAMGADSHGGKGVLEEEGGAVEEVVEPSKKAPRKEVPSSNAARMVRVLHVFPSSDNRRAKVQVVGVMRLDRPSFSPIDYTTVAELQSSKKSEFKLGDLLVLAPVSS